MGRKGKNIALYKQILVLLADNHMNVSEVARILCYHRNTIMYHIGQIKKETGKDPLNLDDLAELLGAGNCRTGRWLPSEIYGKAVCECSQCRTLGRPYWNRCPICEAKMLGMDGEC